MSWAWIFWVNVPIGLAAAAGFVLFLHEGVARERRPVDLAGAALFAVAVASLMIALTEIGTSGSGAGLPAALVLVVSLGLFALQERRAPEPMIALGLWGRRPIAAANGAALLAGMALIGLTTFLPMYVQGVMNRSPLIAGFALTMMVLGWPIGATLSARSFARFGLRPILLTGSCLIPLGSLAFLSLTPDASPVVAGIGSLVMGFGMGLLSTSSIVLIQEIVSWSERGSATASHIFARNLGSTLGATVLGTVLNYGLAHSGRTGTAVVTSDELRRLLETPAGSLADAGTRAALQQSLHLTFWAVSAISLAIVLLALIVPSVELGRRAEAPAE
jgi:MFS family permease